MLENVSDVRFYNQVLHVQVNVRGSRGSFGTEYAILLVWMAS